MEKEIVKKGNGGAGPPVETTMARAFLRTFIEGLPDAGAKVVGGGAQALPDLRQIEVPAVDIAAREDEMRQRRAYAESAGPMISEIRRKIKALSSDPDMLESSPIAKSDMLQLEQAEEKILNVDDDLIRHIEFSAILEDIRWATKELAGKAKGAVVFAEDVMERVIAAGHFFRPSEQEADSFRSANRGRWPFGKVWFKGQHFFSSGQFREVSSAEKASIPIVVHEGKTFVPIKGKASEGTRAIQAELRKMCDEFRLVGERTKAGKMKSDPACSHDLNRLIFAKLVDVRGKDKLFYLFSAEHQTVDRKYGDAHVHLVLRAMKIKEVDTLILQVRDMAGDMDWVLNEFERGRPFVQLEWLLRGAIPRDGAWLGPKLQKWTQKFIKVFRAIIRNWAEENKCGEVLTAMGFRRIANAEQGSKEQGSKAENTSEPGAAEPNTAVAVNE